MFTDLSARSCIERRRRWKSPVSVHADDRRGPTDRGAQARAATQRANSIGWCVARAGALREGQNTPNIRSNKGLHPPVAPYNPRIPSIQASERLRCSQQVAASDRRFRIGILKPPIPGRAKRSSLRQLAVSRILAQSPKTLRHRGAALPEAHPAADRCPSAARAREAPGEPGARC